MNEITVHGNITATPVLRRGQNGEGNAFLTFAVAVNRRYYSSTKGGWNDLPTVFHQVIARYELAEHAAVSLAKGTTVTVTGYFTDNSYVPAGAEQTVRQVRIEATDIAVSLRFATAVVTKRPRGETPAATPRPTPPPPLPTNQRPEPPGARSNFPGSGRPATTLLGQASDPAAIGRTDAHHSAEPAHPVRQPRAGDLTCAVGHRPVAGAPIPSS